MTNPAQHSTVVLCSSLRIPILALALVCALTMVATRPAQAQTFSVIHNFSGGQDGATPYAGLTMDKAGNFYGTNGPPIHSLAFSSDAMCVSSGTAQGLLHGGRNDERNESSRVCKFCAVG